MNHDLSPAIVERIKLLETKYAAMGQDLLSYLDGLLFSEYLTYWDYINLDVLLNIQHPETPFKDEEIFIIYHQITELYFKLCLHAMQQITDEDELKVNFFIKQLKRVNSYFDALIHSFEIMVDGMDKAQFLNFRMALLPASGFQSAQYRKIEIYATNINHLLALPVRAKISNDTNASITTKYDNLYWKKGASELATGKKTLTLRQFEIKYSDEFLRLIEKCEHCNLWECYKKLPIEDQQNTELITTMRQFDIKANVYWPLMHYKSAVRYLQRNPVDIAATGGTNWQKYLPPKNQMVIFYPELWSETEHQEWGKKAAKEVFSNKKLSLN